jgi:hypothetical protein
VQVVAIMATMDRQMVVTAGGGAGVGVRVLGTVRVVEVTMTGAHRTEKEAVIGMVEGVPVPGMTTEEVEGQEGGVMMGEGVLGVGDTMAHLAAVRPRVGTTIGDMMVRAGMDLRGPGVQTEVLLAVITATSGIAGIDEC